MRRTHTAINMDYIIFLNYILIDDTVYYSQERELLINMLTNQSIYTIPVPKNSFIITGYQTSFSSRDVSESKYSMKIAKEAPNSKYSILSIRSFSNSYNAVKNKKYIRTVKKYPTQVRHVCVNRNDRDVQIGITM
jgi:hypothetical protein